MLPGGMRSDLTDVFLLHPPTVRLACVRAARRQQDQGGLRACDQEAQAVALPEV